MNFMRSIQSRQKTSESIKKWHQQNPFSKETKTKISLSVAMAHKENRAGGFKKGNELNKRRTAETIAKSLAACRIAVIGSNGFGKMKRGLQDHIFCKHWIIESPEEERFEFNNLLEWCRVNVNLFPPDLHKCKKPLYHRAAMGICRQLKKEKYPRTHWKGWRLIKMSDLDEVQPGVHH
jgi:hypothetical protein